MSVYIIWWAVSGVIGLFIFILALKIEYGNGIMVKPLNQPLYLLAYPLLGGIVFVLSILFLLLILFDKVKYSILNK